MEAVQREPRVPQRTAPRGCSVGMFNTATGKLQRQLHRGEYDIFKHAQIFEGDFIQITKRGEVIDVHNQVRVVTVGIASTSPILPLPDVMLLARPASSCEEPAGRSKASQGKSRGAAKALELTRLLPLKFVRISIHDREKKQLRLKFPTGRSCYLQLCPPLGAREDLFACWENLVYLLRSPVDSNCSIYAAPARDVTCVPAFEDEDGTSQAVAGLPGKEEQDQISIRSLHVVSEATSAAFAGGEGIQQDSRRFTAMPDVATPNTKPAERDKASAAGAAAGTAGTVNTETTKTAALEQLSVAIAWAATRDPGGSKTSIAIAGAANMSPKSIKMALAGAANQSSECPADTSLSSESSMIVAMAKAEPRSKAAGEVTRDRAAGPPISSLPRAGSVSGGAGRQQRAPGARAAAPRSRRGGREQREKTRALRSPHRRRATESNHKPGGDKIPRKPSGFLSIRQRNDKKEKGGSSPGSSRPVTVQKGVNHAPTTDSRASHKSGRSLLASSSGSTSKRLSRISSFLRTVKANLTTKTAASPHGKDVDDLPKTVQRNSTEAITDTGEDGQGQEKSGSVAPEIRDTRDL
ncbi:Golgi-associated RAB2 interactor protein 4 [Pteronotus mesoamericanus]|uniref:Golgi-associated RAB2 interactor protein 4 n=1 Tax=Pteronotus mesoamericanus TaxID=1884717 RepID=UPI0023EC60C7|nr:Golgi-associated RAB2 interactor protein 4 [Pteronotus parnellii mesoamericanus]